MDNIRIAKQLVGMARELLGRAKFTDGIGEDSDNSNMKYDREYENIIRELYPDQYANFIIMSGHQYDRMFPKHGTMGNGNLILKYCVNERRKEMLLLGLASKEHRIRRSDVVDLMSLYKTLKEQVIEKGYKILADCNEHSKTFLATFAKKNGYYFYAEEPRFMGGNNDMDASAMCVCSKEKLTSPFMPTGVPMPFYPGEDNADKFTKDRKNLDKIIDNGK